MISYQKNKAFTLLELLVVIAVIGILASVVMVSLSNSKTKARDAKRKTDLNQLAQAMELYGYDNNGSYMGSWGWAGNYGPGSLLDVPGLTPTYIPKVPNDASFSYMYWRKDWIGYTCLNLNNINKFAFYAYLENPSAADLATITNGDSFDQCVKNTWGMNYKVGN